MSTVTLRTVKGSELTWAELDGNFTALNVDKLELGATFAAGTANGVPYLNASKVLTSGAVLTFDGTTLSSTKFAGALNGTVGATTPTTGAFTTLSATGTISASGLIKFAGYSADVDDFGIYAKSGQGTVLAAATSNSVTTRIGTANITAVNSTGLAVTGALSATGVTTVQAGTAALPAITTTGDTNTGIFFPAADTIAFTEGGAEAMRIDSSGNLLVNTSSSTASIGQTAKLQVAGGIRTTTGFTSSISLGTIAQNATTTAAVGFNGLWLITNGQNNSALILITLSGGPTGTQLVFSTGSDNVCGTTSEPSGGTYLRLWVSGGVLQVKNVNAYTGPYYLTPICTFGY
jgi:hypothetical protein